MEEALTLKLWLFAVIVIICHAVDNKNIDIVRGESDRFTNVSGCAVSNAICFNESCVDCKCMVNQTFIQTRGQYGKCVSNDLIVYATSYKDSFVLQEGFHKFCLKPHYNKFVVVGSKCGYNNGDQYLWMWTNFEQLLNWQTLECMTNDYQYLPTAYRYFVTMKKCDRNNHQQHWECEGQTIRTGLYRYMYYGAYYQYVTTRTDYASKWTCFVSKKDVCSKAIGCEIFADGSSLVILDKARCEKQSKCLEEKKINLSKTKCFLLRNKTQYLHNDTWTTMGTRNGTFAITGDKSLSKTVLQWDLKKTPKSLGGLLVKVQFECEDSSVALGKTEHCVVIKYTGTFKGFNCNEEDDVPRNVDKGSENGKDEDGNDVKNVQYSSSAKSDKDNTILVIIIIVCVLVLFCAAGMIGIIVYKRRNRFVPSKNTENQVTDENSSPMVEELPESTNPPNNNSQPTSNQSQLQAKPKSQHEYQYVDAKDRTFALQPRNSDYEIPQAQSSTYEYPEIPSQSHQYDYPSFSKPILKKAIQQEANTTGIYTDATKTDSGYTPLIRRPVNNDDDNGYTHLKDVQRKEEEGATEEKDSSNTHLMTGKKASEEGGAKEEKDEADELQYVVPMDSQYTALVRPPLKNGKYEDPSYEPLIKN